MISLISCREGAGQKNCTRDMLLRFLNFIRIARIMYLYMA